MCLGFFFCLTLEFSPESKFLPERVFYIFAQNFCSLNCSKSFPRQFSPDSRVFPPDSRVFPPELVNTKTQKIALKTRAHTLSQNWQFQPEWTISPESMLRLKSSPSPKKATIWFQAQISARWRRQVYIVLHAYIYIYYTHIYN